MKKKYYNEVGINKILKALRKESYFFFWKYYRRLFHIISHTCQWSLSYLYSPKVPPLSLSHLFVSTACITIWQYFTRLLCFVSIQSRSCCSVTQLCPSLCDPVDGSRPSSSICNPMDGSRPSSSGLHCLLKFAQIHIHWESTIHIDKMKLHEGRNFICFFHCWIAKSSKRTKSVKKSRL